MREFPSSLAGSAKALGLGFAFVCALATTNAQAFGGFFDGGGRVGDYLDYVGAANATGARVAIGGVCASACTMKLGARNACVASGAQLWFHAARNPDGRVNALATLMMLQQYPAGIRAWARARGALESTTLTTMSGAEAISLGVRSCDRPAVQEANYSPARPALTASTTAVRACFRQPNSVADFASTQRPCAQPAPATATASGEASFYPQPPSFQRVAADGSIGDGVQRYVTAPLNFSFFWPLAATETVAMLAPEGDAR